MIENDLQLRYQIILPNGHSLYEYFLSLPIEELEALPERGPSDQLGSFPLTQQALALRDYILHRRRESITFQEKHPKKQLEQLPDDALWELLRFCVHQVPFWAYAETAKACLDMLHHVP